MTQRAGRAGEASSSGAPVLGGTARVRGWWRRRPPAPAGEAEPALGVVPGPDLELAVGDATLRLFNTLTTFGTPQDVTLQELRIEMSFPADEASDRLLRLWADEHPGQVAMRP